MENNSSSAAGGGIGIGTLLFLIFMILKLCHVIDWSWWWITAPIWIPAGLILLIMIVAFIVLAIIK